MNKSAIQKYAIWARNELIDKVKLKAFEYGVSKDETMDANADSVNGKILTSKEKAQRQELIKKINELGFDETIEEVAYTWFNRFIALRFMEVNNYLPTRIRVFTNENNEFKPEILKEAMNLEIEVLDKKRIYMYFQANNTEELYKYILISQCNYMGKYLPGMFTKISDYKVLLFPDNLLRPDSVIGRLISDIDEDAWLDQVQIIGWLYQFYNTEPKEKVYARKKGTKMTKEDIPAVTQLFTPDWIVHYMVENSLGRIFINKLQMEGIYADGRGIDEMSPDEIEEKRISNEKSIANSMGWKYFLPEAKQEKEVREQLNAINRQLASKDIQDIKIIDPCMGSGHILVYVFDMLMQIYEANGWTQRDAAVSILENNIYGLDIDKRAYQLAYFSIMMKARSYNRRILTLELKPNVYEIIESNNEYKTYFEGSTLSKEIQDEILAILNEMHDAKEYGSLLITGDHPYDDIIKELKNIDFSLFNDLITDNLLPVIECAKVLSMKFDVTVTNPPYMAPTDRQKEFAKKMYPNTKTDLFAMMIERGTNFTERNGFSCMVTMQAWMFLSSYEKMRKTIINNYTIVDLMQMGNNVMGIAFGTAVSNLMINNIKNYKGTYNQIMMKDIEDNKPISFPVRENRFSQITATNFSKIPGSPIAYWISKKVFNLFDGELINKFAISDGQTKTGNNDKYLRFVWEINSLNVGKYKKWALHAKGGPYRRWYGNIDTVIDWSDEARLHYKTDHVARITPEYLWFRKGICWTLISSSDLHGFRLLTDDSTFNLAAPTLFFTKDAILYFFLAYLNTKIAGELITLLNPTLNTNIGDIIFQPSCYNNDEKCKLVIEISKSNVDISKLDWDSFETSWNFTVHPLVKNHVSTVSEAYSLWKQECEDRFMHLKSNEEELNRIFIDIYGLQDELAPEVEDKDVTVYRVYDSKDDVPESMKKSNYVLTKKDVVVSLISYAVGCMFGRYSLDVEGLAYTGGEFDWSKYKSFIPDKDNIIPICDDEYFEDDIVGRFVKFIEVVYGKSTLDENLSFIASALGGNGNPRDVIRDYFLKDFYKDHCKTYKKRPIYWLFDSGKKNGFKALMYIHRYKPDLIARLRTDYVHETQSRLNHSINMINSQLESDISSSERQPLRKTLDKFKSQAEEVKKYEEIVHHYADQMIPMNLDDGVKVNYAKFKDLLAKIK